MFKHRSIPYIVVFCIVAFLGISYLVYRVYRDYVELQAYRADTRALNLLTQKQHDHEYTQPRDSARGGASTDSPEAKKQDDSGHEHSYMVGQLPHGDYSYSIAGVPHVSEQPMGQRQIEVIEWIRTGKMTPGVEEAIRAAEELREIDELNMIQNVVTPDGQIHQVIVPKWAQYEEGDAILESELDPPQIGEAALAAKPWLLRKLIIDGVEHSPPDEFYSIEDPYERAEYFKKFDYSVENNLSMAEVEKQLAQGELDVSLTDDEKSRIAQSEIEAERSKLLTVSGPELSDTPPVKVSLLPDEGEDALPGWMRKEEDNSQQNGEDKVLSELSYSETDSGSNGNISDDPGQELTNVPSLLDSPDMAKSTPPLPSVADLEKQVTPQGIEAQLREQLSPEQLGKAQQLIDEFGTEEGLRRLRESDPNAARRLERERRMPPQPSRGSSPEGDAPESP